MTEKTEFLPFHAINEYMRPDFRLKVIRDTLNAQSSMEEQLANEINQQIKKNVSIPGFRNSEKAPTMVKVVPTSKAFEKNPELVAIILSGWAELNTRLRGEVYSLLKEKGWKIFSEDEASLSSAQVTEMVKGWPVFPIRMDRTKLPGFYSHWPKGQDFEALYKKYAELHPDSDASIDRVSLMAVWLTMRLPFQVDEDLSQPETDSSNNLSQQ